MVRLGQDFNMRYPLIDGGGNYGSIDGDPAAAMRYTLTRLSPLGELMLKDIKKNTVDFKENFSQDDYEPTVLPGKFPSILCNPTIGIAVGYAVSIPSHNLGLTVDAINYYINNQDCSVMDLFNIIKGPDFPTGGIVINKSELLGGYETGRGRVRIRGKYHVEPNGKNKSNLIFTEIPYGVNKEKLIGDIAKLCEAKEIEGISDLRDESNKLGIRIVLELKKDINPDVMANILFSKTQLENTFSMNFTCIVNKEPKVLNLKELIESYVNHQIEVITRKSKFELNKIQARLHLLEGFLKALEDIDNVVAIIKNSDSASDAQFKLELQYGFSNLQSKAILDMRLAKLTGLEKIEIEKESAELKAEEKMLLALLNDKRILLSSLEEELKAMKAKYSDAPRTEITNVFTTKEDKDIQFVQPEDMVVVATKNGNIKKIPAKSYKIQNKGGKGIKNYEETVLDVVKTNTVDTLIIFSSYGKVYRLLVDDIPTGTNNSRGVGIATLVKMDNNERILAITSLNRNGGDEFVVFVSKQGMVKKTSINEFSSQKRSSNGVLGLKIKENDEIADILIISNEDLLILTKFGKSIKFSSTSIAPQGRVASGVIGIKMDAEDEVVSCLPIKDNSLKVAIFTEMGLGKKTKLLDFPMQNRGGKGTICYKPTASTGFVVDGLILEDEDNIMIVGDNTTICISSNDVPELSKAAMGNSLIKDNKILKALKI